tara:strand:+ start:2013 stop:2567 length:555 start_codon:yes stop_codon:yes gene_type:complete
MAYSKYIASGVTGGGTGFTHNISNPSNAQFAWLSEDHLQIRLSTANETVAAFQTRLSKGTVPLFNPGDGWSISGETITVTGLVTSTTYRFQLERVTPKLNHTVEFAAGAPLTEAALDNSNKYALFRAQELEDKIEDNLLSLGNMKTVANITGDFVDTTSPQTITNKTFQDSTSVFDGGVLSFTG